MEKDSVKVFDDKSEGDLTIYVFNNGLPAPNVKVITPAGEKSSNDYGVITTKLSAKEDHEITIPSIHKKIKVKITPGFESQVIVNLLAEQSDVEVETPKAETQTTTAQGPKVKMRFQVRSERGPVQNATVLFSGLEAVSRTDDHGIVQVDLPEGEATATFFHPEFQTLTLNSLKVEKTSTETFQIELKPSLNQLEDMVVLAPKVKGSLSALVEVRKQSSAVTDVLGAEQMARAGDGDAAASLRRVTGLTLVNGKFVYVRGLGERYSGVLMNQFSLPSPEPTRRVVPLDLFPTAIMESIVVQKSYSPDLPGEFGGGVIQLQTKTLPESFFLRATIATAYERNAQGRLGYKGGSTDWLGIDDGSRQLPTAIKNVLGQGLKLTKNIPGEDKGLTEQQLIDLGNTLPVNYNTDTTSQPSMPNLALSMGNGWKFSGFKLGTAGSLLYGQSIDAYNRFSQGFNVGTGGKFERDFQRQSVVAETEVRLAGSFDVGAEIFKDHKISASAFILRNTTSLAQRDTTINYLSNGNQTEATTLDWTERQLFAQHFKGQHNLQKIVNYPVKWDWRLGLSQANRNSPDRRDYMYDIINGNTTIASDSSGNTRTFSDLTDDSSEMAMDLTIPWVYKARDLVKVKLGFNQIEKNRRSDITRLFFANNFSGATPIPLNGSPEDIFSKPNIDSGVFLLKNLTNEADSYSGEQTISAQYILAEIAPVAEWSFQAGFRRESSTQLVKTFKYFEPDRPFARSQLEMNDVLPVYAVTWKPTDHWRARLAYSETLARPDFRELSTVGFVDDETGYNVQGNANLKGTVIKNIDHRWEYYWTSDEYMSLGLFHKRFVNPIEVMFIPGVNRIQSFDNAQGAENYGIEIENRTGLRHFSRELRRWTLLTNLTLIRSEIELDEKNKGIQTSEVRPLQGQSPYVINLQLQYDRPQWGFSSTLLYNIVGKRITEVGTNDVPDTYEQPFGQLDFVASEKVGKFWTIGFRARNLLNPEIESTQADEVVRSYRRGRFFGLTLGAVL
ncbi:MAG: TonB-dependent receptor [Bdellovibrionales bacterium]|nr:TonB-dependent receptor [Bdellovibrionales bacterium]